jgi:hypothetical protein
MKTSFKEKVAGCRIKHALDSDRGSGMTDDIPEHMNDHVSTRFPEEPKTTMITSKTNEESCGKTAGNNLVQAE